MELSQEQKERIKQNRERALEIQRQRKSLLCTTASVEGDNKNNKADVTATTKRNIETNNGTNEVNMKRRRGDQSINPTGNRMESGDSSVNEPHAGTNQVVDHDKFHTDEIEAFEENASEYITKQEAMKVYCLPMGTLDVCRNCITKPNPKHPTWSDMKLYLRKEIRYRAHQRYGGMLGLIQERNKRNQIRLQKDMEQSRDIFK
jgi:XPA protein C-terminus